MILVKHCTVAIAGFEIGYSIWECPICSTVYGSVISEGFGIFKEGVFSQKLRK